MIPVQDIMHAVFLRSPSNLFDEFISECQKWYENPSHSLSEMRMRDNKKLRGDMFEEFSLLYLKYVKGYKNVWLLKDVPDDVLELVSDFLQVPRGSQGRQGSGGSEAARVSGQDRRLPSGNSCRQGSCPTDCNVRLPFMQSWDCQCSGGTPTGWSAHNWGLGKQQVACGEGLAPRDGRVWGTGRIRIRGTLRFRQRKAFESRPWPLM